MEAILRLLAPGEAQGTGENFTCGDVFNKRAYAGMRLLDSDRRPYYRLAVQEAEAQFGIRADRPMFFEWRYDPVSEVSWEIPWGVSCGGR